MSIRASIEFLGALESARGIRIAPGWEDSLEGRRIYALLWAARQIGLGNRSFAIDQAGDEALRAFGNTVQPDPSIEERAMRALITPAQSVRLDLYGEGPEGPARTDTDNAGEGAGATRT